MADPLLAVSGLSVEFSRRGKMMKAVDEVSFSLASGEVLGLVGESGSGKTTIGRALLRLLPQIDTKWSGTMAYQSTDLAKLSSGEMRRMRSKLQMIFQDPLSSFNPRRRVEDIVAEGLVIHGFAKPEREKRVRAALKDVGFDLDAVAGRTPHQFSGGQCQRIAIARALAVEPELIVCDEPVASLDVSVQAQVINLLQDIRKSRKLALIFISHDLAVVKNVSDRVAVLYRGKIVEIGDGEALYALPAHPYTRTLLEAVPVVDASRKVLPDRNRVDVPSRNQPFSGCAFRTRCPRATDVCRIEEPVLRMALAGQMVACHHPHEEPTVGPLAASAHGGGDADVR
ncbi:peptide ABC transporter ATP-binding protein [Agrobacterium rubi]|uniref:ABC transporter ATP-binding protein n=1 Tax=Agrobacterium rubi TaxID=28099 RepID=UPI00201B8919|nr:ABC transporter ATP-binding protein [Agrobacterium rubi]MCL6650886.1 peptide ABC transporter ATP-binding protein [Agrobacterium rubi]